MEGQGIGGGSGDRQEEWGGRERVEIGKRSGVGEGESGDRQEWKGRSRAGWER